MPIPLPLDYVVERVARDRAEAVLLAQVQPRSVTAQQVELSWNALQDHKWYLSERLGRDVGLPTAAADYFENVQPNSVRRAARPFWQRVRYTLRPIILGY